MATEAIPFHPQADEPNNTQPSEQKVVLDEEAFKSKESELESIDCYSPEWVDEYSSDEGPFESDDEMFEWVYCTKKPHEQRDLSILEYFFNKEEFMDILAHKVMQNTRLKHLTDDLMLSLLEHDDHDVFAGKVNDLVNCPNFIQACSDTYFTETGFDFNGCVLFFTTIETYKDGKPPHERMKHLRDDPFLQHVLEQTECLPITRGVLSALLGFWSDDAFCDKVGSAIVINRRKMKQLLASTSG